MAQPLAHTQTLTLSCFLQMSDLGVIYSQTTSPNTFATSPESKHESQTVTQISVHMM